MKNFEVTIEPYIKEIIKDPDNPHLVEYKLISFRKRILKVLNGPAHKPKRTFVQSSARPVITPIGEFPSINDARKAVNMSFAWVRGRCMAEKDGYKFKETVNGETDQ
jgi:hypothetical protein